VAARRSPPASDTPAAPVSDLTGTLATAGVIRLGPIRIPLFRTRAARYARAS